MPRWNMVQLRQRKPSGVGIIQTLNVYARLVRSRGKAEESAERAYSERTSSWEIRREKVVGPLGRRNPAVDLPAILEHRWKDWELVADGVVYNLVAVLEVAGRPVRYLRIDATFQGQAA